MRHHLIISFCLFHALFGCSTEDPTRNNTFVPLTSIEVTGTYQTMADQTVNQYRAIGDFSGSFTREITQEASWSIDNEFVASVNTDKAGLVKAHAPGETSVTAWYGNISGSAPVIVTDAILTAIDITPQDAELPKGITQQYEADGTFSDSTSQNITPLVTWVSSDPNVATIDQKGLATSLANGSTMITGSWQDIETSTGLLVIEATLTAITITSEVAKIAQKTTVQFQVEGTLSDGKTREIIADSVNWESLDNSIALIDNAGLAEGIAPGQVEISASLDVDGTTLSDTFVLTVTNAAIQSIRVTPENSTIPAGEELQYTATGTFSDNTQREITRDVTWLSNDSSAGSISISSVSRGLFTSTCESAAPCTTFIEAFFDNGFGKISGMTLLTVEPAM